MREVLCDELPGVPVTVGDATTREANDAAVDAAVDAFGGLDVLVNCVGIFDFYRSIGDLEADLLDDAFDEIFRINVKSHLHSVKAALPDLQSPGAASCCSPSPPRRTTRAAAGCSTWPRSSPCADWSPPWPTSSRRRCGSTASRPAARWAPTCAGSRSLGAADSSLGDTPGRAEELAARVPLQVALSGEDHAWSYVFLASDRARGITGGVVHPDGGIGVGHPKKRS